MGSIDVNELAANITTSLATATQEFLGRPLPDPSFLKDIGMDIAKAKLRLLEAKDEAQRQYARDDIAAVEARIATRVDSAAAAGGLWWKSTVTIITKTAFKVLVNVGDILGQALVSAATSAASSAIRSVVPSPHPSESRLPAGRVIVDPKGK